MKAFKRSIKEPIVFRPRDDFQAVVHRFEPAGTVKTPNGPMEKVHIRVNVEMNRPGDYEIAMLLGRAYITSAVSGQQDLYAPDIWWWRDKFWIKGVTTPHGLLDYYHDKCYLLYEVQMDDPDSVFQRIDTKYL